MQAHIRNQSIFGIGNHNPMSLLLKLLNYHKTFKLFEYLISIKLSKYQLTELKELFFGYGKKVILNLFFILHPFLKISKLLINLLKLPLFLGKNRLYLLVLEDILSFGIYLLLLTVYHLLTKEEPLKLYR